MASPDNQPVDEAVTGEPVAARGQPLLEVRNLSKSFKAPFQPRRQVVKDVSFDVHPEEIVGLLGTNGAGKTTTFRMTMGMLRPETGKVFFDGEDVTDLPMYKRARLGMGYLAQKPSSFRYLTVEENLRAILEHTRLNRTEQEARLNELIGQFGLDHVRGSLAKSLSGGETRRLEIARSLITNPRLVLLDEPFAGVDPIAVAEIKELVADLRETGIGILLTDHSVRETLSVTDRAYVMEAGRILSSGRPEEIVNDPQARKAYLGESFTL